MKTNLKKSFKSLTRDELKSVLGGSSVARGDCYATDGCASGCATDGVCNTCCYAETQDK
ncbi:ComC/BlpC family leader-containing pheromone/bacteriocin [Pedobacter sp. MR2016-19]|uniref:ComC/BlpC family leader-containing pheromone/bacteriocin n=1 Tax=Pedobacter sp. MR2016-19 TaxID=2780089 RepID=UPI0018748ABB|nr:ComC/BlpC family leader-containing pheromone/bacteriocin [Pedobacter sp. MR2016-19]MBE5319989.1 ComC/BlpC family leader-containing pheromone/bacteriocin [Pedobacter sp. MR2016-19]